VHDSRIFRDLFTLFERGKEKYIKLTVLHTFMLIHKTEFFHYTGDYSRILLGDRFFITPFPDSYNAALARTRAHNEVNFSQSEKSEGCT